MASKDNILRIKLNGQNFIKFSKQHGGRDFLVSYPVLFQGSIEAENHMTFHTPNGRITFKITSIKQDQKELIKQIISQNKNKIWDRGEIDLFAERELLGFEDPNEIYGWGKISLNLKDSSFDKYFKKTKSRTPDVDFKQIKNITIPSDKEEKITIKFGIAKNYTGDLNNLKGKYDDYIRVEETNDTGNNYSFFFFIEYRFETHP